MSPAKAFAIRAGITLVLAALFVAALTASNYRWDFGVVQRNWGNYVGALGKTLLATAVAFVLGLIVGVFVALARISRPLAVRHIGDLYVEIIRGTPFLVLLLIAVFCVRPLIGNPPRFWT